jgi:hypothetical protein
MSHIVVFGPHAPNDPALTNSRWIAQQHISRLTATTTPVVDRDATRSRLEAALASVSVGGIALCGHGDGGKARFALMTQHHNHDDNWHQRYGETSEFGAVYGSDDEPAFDHENLELAVNRWVHAVTCEMGASPLRDMAVGRGVLAFAAYEVRLVPEFDLMTLPVPALAVLAQLVTSTTEHMAQGCFDRAILAETAYKLNLSLLDWLDSADGDAWTASTTWMERAGLAKFAGQLYNDLCVDTKCANLPANVGSEHG